MIFREISSGEFLPIKSPGNGRLNIRAACLYRPRRFDFVGSPNGERERQTGADGHGFIRLRGCTERAFSSFYPLFLARSRLQFSMSAELAKLPVLLFPLFPRRAPRAPRSCFVVTTLYHFVTMKSRDFRKKFRFSLLHKNTAVFLYILTMIYNARRTSESPHVKPCQAGEETPRNSLDSRENAPKRDFSP